MGSSAKVKVPRHPALLTSAWVIVGDYKFGQNNLLPSLSHQGGTTQEKPVCTVTVLGILQDPVWCGFLGFGFLGGYLASTHENLHSNAWSLPRPPVAAGEQSEYKPSDALLLDKPTHAGTPKAWCVPLFQSTPGCPGQVAFGSKHLCSAGLCEGLKKPGYFPDSCLSFSSWTSCLLFIT